MTMRVSVRFLVVLVSASITTGVGCGLDRRPTETGGDTGGINLALTSMAGSTTYVLANATFAITRIQPPSDVALRLRAPDSLAGDLMVPDLSVGRYEVVLMDGWQLQRQDSPTTLVPVKGTLQSMNPVTVSVFTGQSTAVTFQFQTTGIPLTFGPGSLDIGVGVGTCDAAPPPGVELNVIANSDFELNADGWLDRAGNALQLSNTAHCGVHGGQTVPAGGAAPALTYDLPNFKTTTTYAFSAWVRLGQSSTERVRLFTEYSRVDEKTGQTVGCGFFKANLSVLVFSQVVGPERWTHVEGTATVGGPDCQQGRLKIDSTSNAQFLLIDDVFVIPQ